ncbi:hypothetical protein [Photobacterium carnosum]|uniref:hypothetical protein n=1 Tax=Photobacterium carnosum TaxID=2023717 RepID=UPI00242F9EF5|nr:hypothetical protein [Photobacterium carnosum]
MRSNFFVYGGEYCFEKGGFTTHYHPEFINTLCCLPRLSKVSKKSFQLYWMAINRFLDHIREIDHSLFEHLHIDSPLNDLGSAEQWQTAVISFRSYIDQNYNSKSNKNNYLCGINFWIGLLAHKNKIPRISKLCSFGGAIEGRKPATVVDTALPVHVLEAIGGSDSDNGFEMNRLIANLRAVKVLGGEKIPDNYDDLSLEKKSEWLLTNRLANIRLALESKFIESRTIRAKGLIAIRAHRHLCPLINQYLNFSGGSGNTNPYLAEVRELSYEVFRYALLVWFWYCNGKIQLKDRDGRIYREAAKRLNEKRRNEGLDIKLYGWDDLWFADRIGCTARLYSPALLLLIFDNCMNVTSATNLPIDCINNLGDVQVIEWYKRRAKSTLFKGINSKLRISSLDVVRHVKRVTQAYRNMDIFPQDKNMLFLSYANVQDKRSDVMLPRKPEDETFTNKTKETLADISKGEWFATAEMLRKSILLLSAMKGGVLKLKAEAQHRDSKTSTTYANRAPMKAKHDAIMREFKEWFQTLITIRIDNAAEKLRVDPVDYQRRVDEITESGFGGLVCSNPRGGAQPDVSVGELCNKVARCLTCRNKEHIFIETVDNVMHLLMWQQALDIAIEENKIDATDLNWYFWGEFINTILSRLTEAVVDNKQALVADARNQMSKCSNPYLLIDFKEIS